MPGLYERSNGSKVLIDEMLFPHLEKAHAKLVREGDPEGRQAPGTVESMAARLAELQAEYTANLRAELETIPDPARVMVIQQELQRLGVA